MLENRERGEIHGHYERDCTSLNGNGLCQSNHGNAGRGAEKRNGNTAGNTGSFAKLHWRRAEFKHKSLKRSLFHKIRGVHYDDFFRRFSRHRLFVCSDFSMCVICFRVAGLEGAFYSSFPACAQMFRVLDELDGKYGDKLKTEKINLLEHRDIAKEFKVRYVPHVLFVDKDGKVVKEEVGHVTIDKVVANFKEAGISLE